MSQRDHDLQMLNELLDSHAEELAPEECEVFASMRADLLASGSDRFEQLSGKQRAWVVRTYERVVPNYANLWSRGLVPKGRDVPTPPVLQHLPKKPPPLPKSTPATVRTSRKHCGRTDEGCYAFVNGDCGCACCA